MSFEALCATGLVRYASVEPGRRTALCTGGRGQRGRERCTGRSADDWTAEQPFYEAGVRFPLERQLHRVLLPRVLAAYGRRLGMCRKHRSWI